MGPSVVMATRMVSTTSSTFMVLPRPIATAMMIVIAAATGAAIRYTTAETDSARLFEAAKTTAETARFPTLHGATKLAVHQNSTAIDDGVVPFGIGSVSFLGVTKLAESIAARVAGDNVSNQVQRPNVAKLLKILEEGRGDKLGLL